MPPTPRRTPRKLNFGVIEETPYAATSNTRQCVLAEKFAKRWIPALVPLKHSRISVPVDALFADGSYSKVLLGNCRVLVLNAGDMVRVKDDSHSYTVVRTFKTADRSLFSLKNGDDAVELLSRRGGRTTKTLIKNLFFHNVDGFAHVDKRAMARTPAQTRPPKSRVTPAKVAGAKKSVMENGSPIPNPKRTPLITDHVPTNTNNAARDIFTDCVFVVGDDFWGNLETKVTQKGALTVRHLSDLLDTSNLPQIQYNGPANLKFFAVLGDTISPKPAFLEALCIGWPCLSSKFITDCIHENKLLPWEDYLLGIAPPSGFIKSQSCFEFKTQSDMGFTLEKQFNCRSLVLGCIITPFYVLRSLPPDVLLLTSLACSKISIVDGSSEIPEGCIFIDSNGDASHSCTGDTKLQMCRQPRLQQQVTLHAQWVVECILNQKLV